MRMKAIPPLPLCLVFLVVLVSGCGASREASLLVANKELIRRHQEEIWNKGNTAAIDELYTGPLCLRSWERRSWTRYPTSTWI